MVPMDSLIEKTSRNKEFIRLVGLLGLALTACTGDIQPIEPTPTPAITDISPELEPTPTPAENVQIILDDLAKKGIKYDDFLLEEEQNNPEEIELALNELLGLEHDNKLELKEGDIIIATTSCIEKDGVTNGETIALMLREEGTEEPTWIIFYNPETDDYEGLDIKDQTPEKLAEIDKNLPQITLTPPPTIEPTSTEAPTPTTEPTPTVEPTPTLIPTSTPTETPKPTLAATEIPIPEPAYSFTLPINKIIENARLGLDPGFHETRDESNHEFPGGDTFHLFRKGIFFAGAYLNSDSGELKILATRFNKIFIIEPTIITFDTLSKQAQQFDPQNLKDKEQDWLIRAINNMQRQHPPQTFLRVIAPSANSERPCGPIRENDFWYFPQPLVEKIADTCEAIPVDLRPNSFYQLVNSADDVINQVNLTDNTDLEEWWNNSQLPILNSTSGVITMLSLLN
jgi:hypothetical protein